MHHGQGSSDTNERRVAGWAMQEKQREEEETSKCNLQSKECSPPLPALVRYIVETFPSFLQGPNYVASGGCDRSASDGRSCVGEKQENRPHTRLMMLCVKRETKVSQVDVTYFVECPLTKSCITTWRLVSERESWGQRQKIHLIRAVLTRNEKFLFEIQFSDTHCGIEELCISAQSRTAF